jgi:hypothetical protein
MEKASIKTKPQSLLDGLNAEAERPVLPVVFVCMSHQLTAEQEQDLHQSFGVMTDHYTDSCEETGEEREIKSFALNIVLVSAELKKLTSQPPATYSLAEVQEVAKAIVAEAVVAGASYFVCMGEPTLAMWANLYAGGARLPIIGGCECGRTNPSCWGDLEGSRIMTCLASTTARTSVDEVQADGSVRTTAVFKHVQWRPMF